MFSAFNSGDAADYMVSMVLSDVEVVLFIDFKAHFHFFLWKYVLIHGTMTFASILWHKLAILMLQT